MSAPQPGHVSRMFAMVAPAAEADSASATFEARYGAPPRWRWSTNRWTVCASGEGVVSAGGDPTGAVSVVVVGELFNDIRTPEWVAEHIARRGESGLSELNGHWALIVVDHRDGRAWVAMDRAGTRRVLHSVDGHGRHHLTTDLATHPTEGRSLDTIHAAWMLTARVPHEGRTAWEGVRCLRPAAAHELTPDGTLERQYWSSFIPSDGTSPEAELLEALVELMTASVRRRLDPNRDNWISLSGGRDSMGVAAVVGPVLGFEGMRAFSYTTGEPREGGDAWLAAGVAELAGMEHRVVSSDPDDVLAAFRASATLGQGCAWPAYEVAAWTRIGPVIQAGHRPMLFVGDDRMGSTSPPPESLEALARKLRWWPLVPPLGTARFFASGVLDLMNEGMVADQDAMVERQGGADDLIQLKYRLLWDRTPHTTAAWRDRFAGSYASCVAPWYDTDILDFMARVPRPLLAGKRLYYSAIEALSPEIWALGRAEFEQSRPDYRIFYAEQSDALERWIESSRSQLDDLVSPKIGFELLAQLRGEPSLARSGRRLAYRVRRRFGRGELAVPAAVHMFLRNWVVLRMVLEI